MNFDALIFLWPLLSFAAVVVAIPFAAKIARRAGLVDHPGGRKQHDGAIPLIGGLVIIPVFFSVGVFSGLMSASEYGALMMGAALLLLTGLYDDRYQINPKLKFAVQIIAAIIIMQFGGARIVTLGDLFGLGEIELYYMEEIFTVFCIVLLVNAVNLMDGLDGLAGGKCAIMFGGLLVACVAAGAWSLVLLLAVLIAAICGFLVYNMRHPWRAKASIFMGDAGALALGLILAWFTIHLAQDGGVSSEAAIIAPISAAWIIGLCVMDAVAQFIRRILNGQHPFYADRGHFHHHIVDAGISPARASMIVFAVTAMFAFIGILPLYWALPLPVLSVLWLGALMFHIVFSVKENAYKGIFAALINK